jgi:hypothetical protein
MNNIMRFFLLVGVALSVVITPVQAVEINKRDRLSPHEQVKVNNALAKSSVQANGISGQKASEEALRQGCGAMQIATPTVPRAARVETLVVVKGDVINVQRPGSCR